MYQLIKQSFQKKNLFCFFLYFSFQSDKEAMLYIWLSLDRCGFDFELYKDPQFFCVCFYLLSGLTLHLILLYFMLDFTDLAFYRCIRWGYF